MAGFLTDLFTEKDGVSWCPAKVFWGIGVLAFVVLAAWAVFHGKDFNAQDFGIGFGAVNAGGGVGVAQKGKEE